MPTVPAGRAEAPFVLALDLGSSSLRALIYDAQGREVVGTEGRTPLRWTETPDGGVETDPDRLLDGAFHAIDQAVAGGGGAAQSIAAVGVSTFWHNLMGIGRDGRPSTPLYSWSPAAPSMLSTWSPGSCSSPATVSRLRIPGMCRWCACSALSA